MEQGSRCALPGLPFVGLATRNRGEKLFFLCKPAGLSEAVWPLARTHVPMLGLRRCNSVDLHQHLSTPSRAFHDLTIFAAGVVMRIIVITLSTQMVDEPAADEAKTISVPADSEGRLARDRDAAEPAINSEKLFRGRSSVLIRHGGVTYVLRATRAGKLILTK